MLLRATKKQWPERRDYPEGGIDRREENDERRECTKVGGTHLRTELPYMGFWEGGNGLISASPAPKKFALLRAKWGGGAMKVVWLVVVMAITSTLAHAETWQR